jgi:hypothetical protein
MLEKCVCVFLLLAAALYMGLVVSQKEDFQIDETYSIFMTNGDEAIGPFIPKEEAITVDFFRADIEMAPEGRFQFARTHELSKEDAYSHPPTYYMLLHAVRSVLPGDRPLFAGLLLNLLLFAVTVLALWRIGLRLFRILPRAWALLPPLLYVLSKGAISIAAFVRPYQLEVCASALFALAFLCVCQEGHSLKRDLALGLAALFLAGTQYYPLLLLAACFAGYLAYLAMQKRGRDLLRTLAVGACVAGGTVLLNPTILTLTSAGRGAQAVEFIRESSAPLQSMGGDWLALMKQWVLSMSRDLWNIHIYTPGGQLAALLVFPCIIALAIVAAVALRRGGGGAAAPEPGTRVWVVLMLVSSALYFVVVATIAPYCVARYMFTLYPLIDCMAACVIASICRMWAAHREASLGKPSGRWAVAAAAAAMVVMMLAFAPHRPYATELYPRFYEQNKYPAPEAGVVDGAYSAYPIIVQMTDAQEWYFSYDLLPYLLWHYSPAQPVYITSGALATPEGEIGDLSWLPPELTGQGGLIVYKYSAFEPAEYAASESIEPLPSLDTSNFRAYLFRM